MFLPLIKQSNKLKLNLSNVMAGFVQGNLAKVMFYIFLLLIKQSNICKSLLLFKLNSYQFLFDIFCTNIIATYPIMLILTMIVMIRSQYVLQSIWHSHFHISHVFGSTHILLLFLLPPIFQSVSSVSSSVCYNVLPYLRKALLIFPLSLNFREWQKLP